MHTTNYYNTFIEIAEDCPVVEGMQPPLRGDKRSIANIQYEMLIDTPYKYTSDEVLFQVFAERKDISGTDFEAEKEKFFSKGQPCFRASPLTKRYGWGVHSNGQGRIAIYSADSDEYKNMVSNGSIKKVRAMRSSRR